MKNGALESYDFWSENKHFVYDSVAFEKVNGLYYEFEDLIDNNIPNKSDELLIHEVKEQLFNELVKWREGFTKL